MRDFLKDEHTFMRDFWGYIYTFMRDFLLCYQARMLISLSWPLTTILLPC